VAEHALGGLRAEPVGEPLPLPIAVRVFSELKDARPPNSQGSAVSHQTTRFVFDCETRIDPTQRLTFGSYRVIDDGQTVEEGLFHADDLTPTEQRILRRYAADHPGLRLLTLDQFREQLFTAMYRTRALIIGFNLPFDFSRIAESVSKGRRQFVGGFSFCLWSYVDAEGLRQQNKYRPRFRIKHIDSKRALMGMTSRRDPDPEDLVADDSEDGRPQAGHRFPGYILDLKTLAFALTNEAYSLKRACEDFGVEHGKVEVKRHGVITPEYIDYSRRDVLATAELADKLLNEFARHPVALHPTRAYSPASLGKAYLAALGIPPILDREHFPTRYVGFAQTAFYGGRTSAHIRRTVVPVVYTDFLSMYPTVNALMELRRILTARDVRVVEHCGDEIRRWLSRVTAEVLFKPQTWPQMTAFVLVQPDGDLLPCRGVYSDSSKDWQVGINYVYAGTGKTERALWYALPDVVASVLRTGRMPNIVDAFRVVGVGQLRDLKPVKFRSHVTVDPRKHDFFRAVVELRQQLKTDRSPEAKRTADGLKVLANSTAYGINAEFIREDRQRLAAVVCHGLEATSFEDRVEHPERPGRYCFPPLAALITAGARLMLSLLEHEVERRGGTYAMEDTDSMAIVATESGGLVPCVGGPHRLSDGSAAVKALRWQDVHEMARRFEALNPYNRQIVRGSILKIEDVNFQTGQQRQVYCYAISAKRYALFERDDAGEPHLLLDKERGKWSDHGLGHLRNPTNPEGQSRDWIGEIWQSMIRQALGRPAPPPSFAALPAVGRVTVTSPEVLRPFQSMNKRKPYGLQIKPFNFLLTAHVSPAGHPTDVEPERFHLIAPYNPNPSDWPGLEWIDQYSGQTFRAVTGSALSPSRGVVHVKDYASVLEDYAYHPESKCADATGAPSGRQTVGLHFPRHVVIEQVRYIGKEANELEDVDAGLVHSADEVFTEYVDARRDFWQTVGRPAARRASIDELQRETGLPRQTIVDARLNRRKLRKKTQARIYAALRRLGYLRIFVHERGRGDGGSYGVLRR
jgi:hypothetical protein